MHDFLLISTMPVFVSIIPFPLFIFFSNLSTWYYFGQSLYYHFQKKIS